MIRKWRELFAGEGGHMDVRVEVAESRSRKEGRRIWIQGEQRGGVGEVCVTRDEVMG